MNRIQSNREVDESNVKKDQNSEETGKCKCCFSDGLLLYFPLPSHLDRWTHPCSAGFFEKKKKKIQPSMLVSVKRATEGHLQQNTPRGAHGAFRTSVLWNWSGVWNTSTHRVWFLCLKSKLYYQKRDSDYRPPHHRSAWQFGANQN